MMLRKTPKIRLDGHRVVFEKKKNLMMLNIAIKSLAIEAHQANIIPILVLHLQKH